MGVTYVTTEVPQNLKKWIYQTEYNRSFDRFNIKRKPNATRDEEEYVSRRLIGDDSLNPSKTYNLEKLDVPGNKKEIKKNENSVAKAILSKGRTKKEALTKIHSTCGRKLRVSKEERLKESSKKTLEHRKSKDEIYSTPPSKTNEERVKVSQYKVQNISPMESMSLSLVAGKDSLLYERGPFIQSKRRIRVPNKDHFVQIGVADVALKDDRNSIRANAEFREPRLQTKKIVPYHNNHNIFRTNTVEFANEKNGPAPIMKALYEQYSEKDQEDKLYLERVMARYQKHKSNDTPERFRSSYSLDFNEENSPLLSVQSASKIGNNATSRFDRGNTSDDDRNGKTYIYRKTYSPRNYVTEYESRFKDQRNEMVSNRYEKRIKDQGFNQYFENVLDNRKYAYHPNKEVKEDSPFKKVDIELEKIEKREDNLKIEDLELNESTTNMKTNTALDKKTQQQLENGHISETSPKKKATIKSNNEVKNIRREYTPSVSGDSVRGSSYCSCASYPSSYDPSIYSDR